MKKLSLSALSLLTLTCANATQPAETKMLADTALMLGEVSVTAIKQQADLTLQPTASTVIGSLQVERFNITDMKGVSEIAPNFYIPDYGSRMTSSIYVRGIGARIDQPAVGLNVDNVAYLNKDAYDFDLTDIERIEVLRGAQSSLYGRNTMAGQINIYTLSPLYYQGTRVLGQIGNGPEARLALSHYRKFKPSLAMAFTGNFNFSDGFYKNYYNAKKVGTDKSLNLRWKTDWVARHDLTVNNVAAFSLSRQGGYPYELVGSGMINYNDTCFYRRNAFTDGLTVKWTRPGFSISSITSVQYIDDNMTLDQDFTPLNIFTLTQRRHEWAVSQDFVARGTKNSYSWLAGLFGFTKRTHMHAPVNIKDEGIAALITDRINNNDKIPIKLEWNDPTLPLNDDFTAPVWGLALYHQSSLDLGRWNLGVGLRLDYESTGLHYRSYTSTSYDIIMPGGMHRVTKDLDLDLTGRLHDDFLELLPKFTVTYRLPMPGASDVYLSVGKGYKSGGFNTQMFSEVLQQNLMLKMMEDMPAGGGGISSATAPSVEEIVAYKPEKSWNYEVGTHVTCADGRVRCDLAAFYIRCRDQQLTMFPEGSTTGRITSNAGKSRMWGAEAQIRFMPVRRLLFNLNYGYTNAKFVEFIDGNNNYANKYVPYAPSHTLFVSGTYRQPLPWRLNALEFTASARGVGHIWWDEENSLRQPFYATMSASATLCTDWMDIEFWMDNVTGTRYDVFYFKSMENRFIQRGAPRRWGLTIRYNFNS